MPPENTALLHVVNNTNGDSVLLSSTHFLFEGVCQGSEFLLQQEVLEATFLLHLMNGLHKPVIQVVSFFLNLNRVTMFPICIILLT